MRSSALPTRFLIGLSCLALGACGIGHRGGPESAGPPPLVVGQSGLAIPVAGVRRDQLRDTFRSPRGGGSRSHDAIDIMAAEGTPVIAAADGTVERLHQSRLGGITAYVRSPDRKWVYYYAHMRGYARGLKEGQRLRRGDLIGFVGHTGNATASAPHLHFAVNRMGPGERWYQGTPVNPYPLLAGNAPRR